MSFSDAAAQVCAPGTMFEIGDGEVLGAPSKVFVHAPPDMRSVYALAAARTDEFIVFEDERWTMPAVLDLAGRIGDSLVNRLGVGRGDRVGIAMRNYPEWIATFLGVTSVGAVVVPLNAW
jgi:long-chain acyl-CoA synthetase